MHNINEILLCCYKVFVYYTENQAMKRLLNFKTSFLYGAFIYPLVRT